MNHNDLPDEELAATLEGLAAAVAAVRAENVGQPSDDFNDRLRRRMSEAIEPERAETTRPTFLTRSRTTWRWIMRSPVSRVAAAAILVLAIGGVVFWFHGGGTTPACADFLQPILEAKTVKYKLTTERTGPSAGMARLMSPPEGTQKDLVRTTTAEVMMLDANRSRMEFESRGKSKKTVDMVNISDQRQGKGLWLYPAKKRATAYNTNKTPRGGDPLAHYRSLLLDARDKPNVKREPLGEKDIDGRHVIGFRISSPEMVTIVWGDPKTGLPVRIEATASPSAWIPNLKTTMSDFAFNVHLDESLFSVEPPAGYEVAVHYHAVDDAPAKEKDLIEMLRYYGEVSGGRFPDLLEMEWLTYILSLEEWTAANIAYPPKPKAKREQENHDAHVKPQRGMAFTAQLPPEADAHYAGQGISLGAADRPIFWYRPKDSKKYRVIYADLTVRDADTPPSVPVVPVVQREKDLIEMFRQYSTLCGGPFPDSISLRSLALPMMKLYSRNRLTKRSAKEEQEVTEVRIKLLRGLTFTALLSAEADWHYAGGAISLGAADKPIFWYRPQDSKKYRVIYADLSVHEADTPPNVTNAQPVPGPSSSKK
jgi:outer membrane lipoprotein-sorting protein